MVNRYSQSTITNIGIYGIAQAISALAALIRIPVVIKFIGVENFGRLVSVVSVFSIPMMIQGALRLHFRKKFSHTKDLGIFPYLKLVQICAKFSARKFRLLFFGSFVTSLLIVSKNFPNSLQLSILVIMILLTIFISIVPTGIYQGYLDHKRKQNYVIIIDLFSSIISIPAVFIASYYNSKLFVFLLILSSTFWAPILCYVIIGIKLVKRNEILSQEILLSNVEYGVYIKQTLGSSLTLNFNSMIFSLTTSPEFVAKINISEKFLSAIFVPTAALAPSQSVSIAKIDHEDSLQKKYFMKRIFLFNFLLTIFFTIPIFAIASLAIPILSGSTNLLDFHLLAIIAISYLAFTSFSTLLLINFFKTDIKIGIPNLSIVLGFTAIIICLAISSWAMQYTFLMSIFMPYAGGCLYAYFQLFKNRIPK
jgi:O-antigen/teichoic acid export membrane protein